jgi:hypothetical protein
MALLPWTYDTPSAQVVDGGASQGDTPSLNHKAQPCSLRINRERSLAIVRTNVL